MIPRSCSFFVSERICVHNLVAGKPRKGGQGADSPMVLRISIILTGC